MIHPPPEAVWFRGLENLRDRANEMANEDTTAIVEQFGQMGRRRFDLVA